MNAASARTSDPAEAVRPGVAVALALLRAYKVLLSPFFAGSCRFLPSCSDFAREAVIRHGVLRGMWLAARRLARCHPLGASGYDPVPSSVHSRLTGACAGPGEARTGGLRVCRK